MLKTIKWTPYLIDVCNGFFFLKKIVYLEEYLWLKLIRYKMKNYHKYVLRSTEHNQIKKHQTETQWIGSMCRNF